MKRISAEAGMTLIEVLISMLIFSVGALGVLGMFTTTLYLNMDARQSQEANVIGNWIAEQIQAFDALDTRISCAVPACYIDAPAGVWTNGAGTAMTITVPELQGDVAYGNRYQATITRVDGDSSSVPDRMLYYRINVAWPRNREARALDPASAGYVNCLTTPTVCRRVSFHTYKGKE